MSLDSKDLSAEEKEKIRLAVLNVLAGEPVKHYTGNGDYFFSDNNDGNPYSRHNTVLRNMEP